MKRIFMFLLLMIFSTTCFALDDACTKPSAYTMDKRCYVKSSDKTKKPYNAVVSLAGIDGKFFCTGTIVKYNNKLYLYTAKHCTDVNRSKTSYKDTGWSIINGHFK